MQKIACYCQSCRAANELGETKCRRCGTRLLLVVFPQSLKFDTNHVPSYYEDHLLERVSALELRLAQVTEQLASAYEIIKRETLTFQKDRARLNKFFEVQEKTNPEIAAFNRRQTVFSDEKNENFSSENEQEKILETILSFHGDRQRELFTHLVKEAFKLFRENEERQSFQTLERAALISPDNIPLLLFIAENFFRVDKFSKAKQYLEITYELDARNEKVLLLLGAIYADEAHAETVEKARKLLSVLADKPQTADLANFIWGILAACEENWSESAAAFKQSLRRVETPEIYYLIGCVHFQLKSYKISLQNLQKAVSLDSKFADAWFMQSIVYEILGDENSADKAVRAALESKEAGAQCLEFLKRQKKMDLETALPFQHFARKKRILTQGSIRLNNFFRRRLFESLN